MSRSALYKVTVKSQGAGIIEHNLPLIRMLRKECVKFYNATSTIAPHEYGGGIGDHRYLDKVHTVNCKKKYFTNDSVFFYKHTFKIKKQTLFAAQMFYDIKKSEYVTIKRIR